MARRKKNIKDKKLQSIREANIQCKLYKSKKTDEYVLKIEIDKSLEPACRPRTTSRFSGMYDPLAAYKNVIKSKVNEYILNLPEKKKKLFPYDKAIRSRIIITKKPNKTDSLINKFLKIVYSLPVLGRPDIDNIEKTAWDMLLHLVFTDDSLIYDTHTTKLYGENDYTIIKIYLEKENPIIKEYKGKRLSKDESTRIKEIYNNESEENDE